MKWTEAYATGVPHLDTQHKLLFQMTSDFLLALDEGRGQGVYGPFLESLDLYAKMHFSTEEECMLRYNCPAARGNAAAHQRFLGIIGELRRHFGERGYRREDAQDAVALLEEWLVRHIGGIDTQLRPLAAGD